MSIRDGLGHETDLSFSLNRFSLVSLVALIHSLGFFLGQSNMMQMCMYVHVYGHNELGQSDPLFFFLLTVICTHSLSYEHLHTQHHSHRTVTLCVYRVVLFPSIKRNYRMDDRHYDMMVMFF